MSTELLAEKKAVITNGSSRPTPDNIMRIGMGFWASKTLLTAVDFRLFTILSGKKLSGAEIKKALKLKTTDRHVFDFLDTLVGLGFLKREGLLENAVYSNAPDADIFLDENKPSFMGGILKMGNHRLYHFWGDLDKALLTGQPQNETKGNLMESGFDKVYESPERLREFINAMSGIQMGNFMAVVNKFDFGKYKTVCDIGGADGTLSVQIASKYPGVNCTTTDLKQVGPLANEKIASFKLQDRIKFVAHDFIKEAIPSAEVITMGNIVHGLNEEQKVQLIKRVYDALPAKGVFMVIENIIDNDRRQNTFGMMMSLNMLIENGDAFDYSMDDFDRWIKKAGFKRTELIPLTGPTSAAIAYK